MQGIEKDDFEGLAQFVGNVDGECFGIVIDPLEHEIAKIAFRVLGFNIQGDPENGSLQILPEE